MRLQRNATHLLLILALLTAGIIVGTVVKYSVTNAAKEELLSPLKIMLHLSEFVIDAQFIRFQPLAQKQWNVGVCQHAFLVNAI
ncbi:hypothetical protein GUJ93_ZPchr0013g34049 [Zizania palustris]|uniref:Uncharacterized protein n=1 Tax=Zizania palustris TaxID=103762 RepID=A0A8J6C159_ZIZPA|nr:hypothetical protein GUJ93_ZPchr0013g34049 [Zizania palustris]